MRNLKTKFFFKRNLELILGTILIITHSLVWFLPAYILSNGDIKQYKFFKIFPEWFIYSSIGSFILVVSLVIVYIIYAK